MHPNNAQHGLQPKKRRIRNAALFLASSALFWLVFTVFRARHLLNEGRKIAAQSQNFKRDYMVGDAKAAPLTLLVMGDSTAAGWGAGRLEDTYPFHLASSVAALGYRVHVVNIAVGGARFHDVRVLQLPQISARRPDLISLSVGANDATHFESETEITREMRLIVAALRQSDARLILIANTPDMSLAPALPLPFSRVAGARGRRLNTALSQILRSEIAPNSKIRSVDLFRNGKLDYHRDPTLYAADLFHPSARGYDIWGQVFSRNLVQSKLF